MAWPKQKHNELLETIQSILVQVEDTLNSDKNSASWQYEEGVLISVNQARLILDALADLGKQVLDVHKSVGN